MTTELLRPLFFLACVFGTLAIVYRDKGFRAVLLSFGFVAMPFRISYTLFNLGPYEGWTGSFTLWLSDLAFIALFIISDRAPQQAHDHSRQVMKPAFWFVAACAVSMVNSTWLAMSLVQILMICQIVIIYYWVIYRSLTTVEDIRIALQAMLISLVLQGALCLAQTISGATLDFFSNPGSAVTHFATFGEDAVRAIGTIGKPNGLAEYIVPILLLALACLFTQCVVPTFFAITSSTFGFLALLLSFSRGGLLSFCAGACVLVKFLHKTPLLRKRNLLLMLLPLCILAAVLYPEISMRLFGDDANAAMSRVPLMGMAINMFKAHPFFGVGINTFRSVIRSYLGQWANETIYLYVVHNQYLMIAAEAGLFGLVTFIVLFRSFFRQALFCIRQESGDLALALGAGVFAAFVSSASHMMVDMYCSHMILGLLFSLTALCSASYRIHATSTAVPHPESSVTIGSYGSRSYATSRQ